MPQNKKDLKVSENSARNEHIEILSSALRSSTTSDGYWLNAKGKLYPVKYGKPVGDRTFTPYMALMAALHSDQIGALSNVYIPYSVAKNQGWAKSGSLPVSESMKFLFYRWDKMVNIHNPKDIITKERYQELEKEHGPEWCKKNYKNSNTSKSVSVNLVYNIDQTTIRDDNKIKYNQLMMYHGAASERNSIDLYKAVQGKFDALKVNIAPARWETGPLPSRYDADKDIVYINHPDNFVSYSDFVQEVYRAYALAVGSHDRLARAGQRTLSDGQEGFTAHEIMLSEIVSGLKMLELGLPAKIKPENRELAYKFAETLSENPNMSRILEKDINLAFNSITAAEKGQKLKINAKEALNESKEYTSSNSARIPSSSDILILQDTLRRGGEILSPMNFASPEERQSFIEKYDLDTIVDIEAATVQVRQQEASFANLTKDIDPSAKLAPGESGLTEWQSELAENINLMYTQMIDNPAEKIRTHLQELIGIEQARSADSFAVSEELRQLPDAKKKSLVYVVDPSTRIVDVILPHKAEAGGQVHNPVSGIKSYFYTTPDSVATPIERQIDGCQVKYNNPVGMSKAAITREFEKKGYNYVRFYNRDGFLAFNPSDDYFKGKKVFTGHMVPGGLVNDEEITPRVQESVMENEKVKYEWLKFAKLETNKWVMVMKPQEEDAFIMYPENKDRNWYFTTLQQERSNIDRPRTRQVENALFQKYYAMAKSDTAAKQSIYDVFGTVNKEDVSRIKSVKIWRHDDDIFINAKIEGVEKKLRPSRLDLYAWNLLNLLPEGEIQERFKATLAAQKWAHEIRVAPLIQNNDEEQEQKTGVRLK